MEHKIIIAKIIEHENSFDVIDLSQMETKEFNALESLLNLAITYEYSNDKLGLESVV
jgi:hypothetical protein